MSIAFNVEYRFSWPPDRVFAAITDLDRVAEWMPNHVRIEPLTEGPFGVGTEWRETRKMFGHEGTEQFEVTVCEAPSRLGLRVDGAKGSSKRGEYIFTHTLAPDAGGTRMLLEGEIRGLGKIATFFGRMLVGPLRKACVKDLRALDTWLAQSGSSAH